jgi:ubiquinone/menaquinone biosynthesis C-methylase UbiE
MTGALAERFDRVLAVDVSPAMVERARAAVQAPNVEFRVVSGDRLDGIDDESAHAVVCYLVLQHLPSRAVVKSYLREFARVLTRGGEAFVQLPVLDAGALPRAWRVSRSMLVPVLARVQRNPASAAAFRGFRLTRAELDRGLAAAGLRVVATDAGPDAPYRHATDLFLRLRRS